MPQVRGVVKQTKVKEGVSKKTGKPYKVHSMAVDHGDGSLTWYGCGFDQPNVREESVITFEAGKNNAGYDTADVSTIQLDKQASGGQGQTQSNAAPANSQSFGADRQRSITLQTATKIAAHVADSLVANKLMPLPPANSRDKKETAMEAYISMVEQLAARFQGHFSDPAAFEEKFINDLVEDAIDEGSDNGPRVDQFPSEAVNSNDVDDIPW